MSLVVNVCLTLVAAAIGPECYGQGIIDGIIVDPVEDWISEVEKINKPELDKEWRDYVEKLGGEYEEVPRPTPLDDKEEDFKDRKEFLDWNPTSPFEVPFLAIIYAKDKGPSPIYKEFFKGEPNPGESHVEPGTACGGALITPKYLLTMCGCIFQVIQELVFYELEDLFGRYDPAPKYRIKGHLPGAPARLFVTFSLLRFVPDFEYEVDEDRSQWPTSETLNCKSFITVFGSTDDKKIRALRADGELALVPYKNRSDIDFHPAFYPMWPPHSPVKKKNIPAPPLPNPNAYFRKVKISSVGMILTEKTKIKFQSSIQVSSLEAEHCTESNEICDSRIWTTKYTEADWSHVCFCPVTRDRRPQLVGGTIGWPVVDTNGSLVGLTATERHPGDGTVVVAMITKYHVDLIEEFIGKDVLLEQNKPPFVYREKDLNKDFLLYDYWARQFRTPTPRATRKSPTGKSRATQLGPKTSHLLFAIICFLLT